MGYPTIDKFDIRFIERTLTNVKMFRYQNRFTHLINSLLGLIFIPHEFAKKGKRQSSLKFLNSKVSDCKDLVSIFSGSVKISNEAGDLVDQPRYRHWDNKGNPVEIQDVTVGNLIRLFRNGIAHQHIVPVAEHNYWIGIIVRNFQSEPKEKLGHYNFEVFLNQRDLRIFATFIGSKYIESTRESQP
jgi:hypothetical protein